MSDFPNIHKFIERQRKAETACNGYPADRVIPSNKFQAGLAKEVERLVIHTGKLTQASDYWQDKAQKLQAELDARQVDATLTHGGKE